MKRLLFLSGLGALAVVAADAVAQTPPDFSGRWVNEAAAPAGARGDAGAAGAGARGGARGGGGGGGGGGGARGGGASNMGSGWGSDVTITQDASKLTVQYAFFGRGDMQPPLRFTYALDGSETKNTVMMGRGIQEQIAKTAWEGSALVITTTHTIPNPGGSGTLRTEVKQKLTLDSPTSLIVETTRSGVMGGQPTTTRTPYTKQ